MKVGLVGYKKPEIESLLQAYSIKKFLSEYNVDCTFAQPYINMEEDEELIKFQKDMIGDTANSDITTFLMINYKAFVDMKGKEAAFRDFYQRSFGMKEVIMEALFLQSKASYDDLAMEVNHRGAYVFLDCMSDRSTLVPLAVKYAKSNNMKLIATIDDKKYNRLETIDIKSPQEYLSLVKNASFVITDSFMSLFFAVLYHKPFITQDCPALPGKNKRFVKRLDLMEHYYAKEEMDITKDYQIKHSEKVDATLHQLKTDASNYLFECLPPMVKDCEVEAPPKIMKSECCGCYACKEICPENAITMVADSEGFYYPQVNDNCNNCNKCVTACVKKENPQTIAMEEGFPKAFCAMNVNDGERRKCTSGGVFPLLTEYVIEEKQGVVFGVAYDEEMNVVYGQAETKEEVEKFYGVKYAKAQLDGVYPKVKQFLENGRFVLFTGLPCECAGLKAYLEKDYENLLVVDLLCHSAASPKVFKKYVDYISDKYGSKITNMKFRDKSRGWLLHKASIVFEFEDRTPLTVNARRNNYFRNYLNDNISMPGCSNCSFLVRNRVGELTLGDFFGIEKIDKEMFDNNGASLILANTEKGMEVLRAIKGQLRLKAMTMGKAFKYHNKRPMQLTKERGKIFERLGIESIDNLLETYNDLK